MYLYTDVIEFAPFGSEENRRSRSAEIAITSDDKVPRSSPKSIYRLADKVWTQSSEPVRNTRHLTTFCRTADNVLPQCDIPRLKTLALDRIRDELGKCDIVEETFSGFSSR